MSLQLLHIRPPGISLTRVMRAAAVAVSLAVACASCAAPTSSSQVSAGRTKPAVHSSALGPRAFAELAGDWTGHGSNVSIQPDGRFLMIARTYQTCGHAPPPCDTVSGSQIVDGDMATGQLTSIVGAIATGSVTHTTDAADSPDGPMKIILYASTDSITANNSTFCGPDAPTGYCGA